jgi:hypothetical protein
MPDPDQIPFTPVPFARRRRTGWTPERQRAFIDALARCGSVSAAAREAGLSARSAYALLDRDGSDSFAAAWDQAVERGIDAARDSVIDRAMHGGWVPVFRRGKVAGLRFRYFDRMALALLSGRKRNFDAERDERAARAEVRRYWREHDRLKLAEQKAEMEWRERLRAQAETPPARPRAGPRITIL